MSAPYNPRDDGTGSYDFKLHAETLALRNQDRPSRASLLLEDIYTTLALKDADGVTEGLERIAEEVSQWVRDIRSKA